MHRSWSMPVAQALQRHSGGWTVKPPDAHAEAPRPADKPPVETAQDGSPTHAPDDRAPLQRQRAGIGSRSKPDAF